MQRRVFLRVVERHAQLVRCETGRVRADARPDRREASYS